MVDTKKENTCERALTKTYFNLLHKNLPESAAFDAAIRVFRFHHPEIPFSRAKRKTQEIIDQNRAHSEN